MAATHHGLQLLQVIGREEKFRIDNVLKSVTSILNVQPDDGSNLVAKGWNSWRTPPFDMHRW